MSERRELRPSEVEGGAKETVVDRERGRDGRS